MDITKLHRYPVVSIDVETTGLYWYKDSVFGIAVAAWDGHKIESDYYDIRTTRGKRALDILRSEIPLCQRVVNHSIKFDVHMLWNEGVIIGDSAMECTAVRASLICEHERSMSLDSLAKKYLNKNKVDIYGELAGLFGGKSDRETQIKNLHRAPESLVKKYAVVDAELAIELWLWQEEEIKKQGLEQVWGLEKRLTPVLVGMERQGVEVDLDLANRNLVVVDEKIDAAKRGLDALAGTSVNANSSPQMRALFKAEKHPADNPKGYVWKTNNGFMLPMTDSGGASIDKDVLVMMAEQGDKRAEYVLKVRKLVKAKSFLKDHIIGHEHNGRVYPNYNQMRGENDMGTITGRLSINDPALQQIPSRDVDVAEIARSCFVPGRGNKWCCADWAQFEFRWFAHYTQDPKILKAYEDDPDTDYHQIVSDLTGIPRKPRFAGDANAKQINLGLVFGMGKGKMAYEMGMDYNVYYDKDGNERFTAGPGAEEVFNTYHNAIPGVSSLLSKASSIAKARGYVKTITGRHIRFPEGKFTHKAGGLVFQGSSADCMKLKMVELWPVCKKEGMDMLLSVHDELDFAMPDKEAARQSDIVRKSLETFDGIGCEVECRVPIKSDVCVADNWFIASK